MTAYIDNIIIQGTLEEIQEFIELRKKPEARITFPDMPYGITDNRMEWAVKNGCNPIQVAHILWMIEDQAIMNIDSHV